MIYIAYGANMSKSSMMLRCPGAKVIGTGKIENYLMTFKGCATIEPKEGEIVPVVVWNITKENEKELDRFESYPHYYYKKKIKVVMDDGSTEKGMVYIMQNNHDYALSFDGYVSGIRKSYKYWKFDIKQLEKSIQYSKDREVKLDNKYTFNNSVYYNWVMDS